MDTKANLLGRVMEIIQTLQGSLDHSAGGELAQNLDRLYDYMNRRLLEATSQNNLAMIDEVMSLLLEVKQGWDGIRQEYLQSLNGTTASPSVNSVSDVRLESHISV